jgi:epoxyqueuosine reductase QueG
MHLRMNLSDSYAQNQLWMVGGRNESVDHTSGCGACISCACWKRGSTSGKGCV